MVMQTRATGSSRFDLQVLDVVELGELAAVVGSCVLLEFLEGLPAQVASINQEQDTAGIGKLDQAIDRADRGEGLAAACGHLDQGPGSVGGEGLFQVPDRPLLRRPEPLGDQGRQNTQAAAQRRWRGSWRAWLAL